MREVASTQNDMTSSGTRDREWPLLAIGAALLSLIVWRAAQSGTWLDEYWQLWISAAPDLATLGQRLVADTHPPWFNLAARAILALTGGSLPEARLISLALAVGVLNLGLWRLSRSSREGGRSFHALAALFVLGMAGPVALIALADSFRSYPWLIILAALQGTVLIAIARDELLPSDRLFAALVTLAAITLHYVASVAAIAIALVTVCCALRRGRRADAIMLSGALALGVALQIATGLLQMPQWRLNIDSNWIAAGGSSGLATLSKLLLAWALTNMPAAGCILLAAMRRRLGPEFWWLLAPIPVAVLTWLILDMVTPMIVTRYLVAIPVLLSLAGALAASRIATTTRARVIMASLLLLNLAANEVGRPLRLGWDGNARTIATELRRCPTLRVLATSQWNLGTERTSRAAAFEMPVAHFAYRIVGGDFGFEPQIAGPTAPIILEPTRCGAVLWVEHASNLYSFSPTRIVVAAGITAPPDAVLSFTRGENGGLVWIGSASSSNFRDPASKAAL